MEPGKPTELPSLLVLPPGGGEVHYVLDLEEIFIGRDRACAIVLSRRGVSRRHALIRIDGERATVQDLGSTNGTSLNGKPLGPAPVTLHGGDCIDILGVEIRFLGSRTEKPGRDEASVDEALITETETDMTGTGGIGSTIARSPSLLESPEAEATLLRVVLSRSGSPRLVIREGGMSREVVLKPRKLVIGRGSDCEIRLRDEMVSTRHALIRPVEGSLLIEDLDSRNGIRVNGVAVSEHRLGDDDVIRIGGAVLIFSAGGRDTPRRFASQDARRQPVVVVPGFAASELWNGETKIWPNHRRMLATPEPQLLREWQELRVGRIVREVTVLPGFAKYDSFGSLIGFLTRELGYRVGRDLLEFPYDWRQDNQTSASQLARAIRRWRKQRIHPTDQVTIVAHSMGGLVARLYLAALGGADAVRRCIFLGTPHLGTAVSFQVLAAGSGLLPFGIRLKKIQKLVKGFPSQYQVFPVYPVAELTDGCPFFPLRENHDWLEPAYRPLLEKAAEFRELIDAEMPGDRVPTSSIFGYQQRTLARIRLQRDRSGRLLVVDEEYDRIGDGTVAEISAVLEHGDIHPVNQQHGVLHSSPDVLRRLRFELTERE